MRRLILLGGAAVLAGVGCLYAARLIYSGPGPLPQPREVVVPRGGLREVGQALAASGVIRGPRSFELAAAATVWQGPIHAAELAFPAHASLEQVLGVLRFGRPVLHKLTIPEGLTAAQIAMVLGAADFLSGNAVVPPEGAVLPQTYEYRRGTSRAAAVDRGEAAMHRALSEAWAQRAPGLPLRSPRQALILASLVERETGLPAERPMVARVFLNRLQLGMKLQSDPSAAYGASGGMGALGRPLDRSDLARADPYNTYVVPGLPAGPICSPGLASIEAVLHPAASAALYFVADGRGGHVFATSLQEHDRNVERRRQSR